VGARDHSDCKLDTAHQRLRNCRRLAVKMRHPMADEDDPRKPIRYIIR